MQPQTVVRAGACRWHVVKLEPGLTHTYTAGYFATLSAFHRVVIATPTADEAARFEQSFRSLYTSELLIVLRYLRANVADSAEAEELCAETFLRAWVAWPRFRGQPQEARSWLLRIARNLVIDRHRRQRLLRIFPLQQQDSTGRDPTASEAINRVHLQKAMGRSRPSRSSSGRSQPCRYRSGTGSRRGRGKDGLAPCAAAIARAVGGRQVRRNPSQTDPELAKLDQRLQAAFQEELPGDAEARVWQHLSARVAGRGPRRPQSSTPTVLGLAAVTAAGAVALAVTLGVRAGVIHVGPIPATTPTPPAKGVQVSSVSIGLDQMPRGSVLLDWGSGSGTVTVGSKLIGLTPAAQQQLSFYQQSCGTLGQPVGMLTGQATGNGSLILRNASLIVGAGPSSVRSIVIRETPLDNGFAGICADFGPTQSIASGGQEAEAILPTKDTKPIATANLALFSDNSMGMQLAATRLDGKGRYTAQLHDGYCGLGGFLLGKPASFPNSIGVANINLRFAPSPDFATHFRAAPSFLAIYSGQHLVACGDIPLPVTPPPTPAPGQPVAGWLHAATPLAPPARSSAAVAFDAATQQVVLFGGTTTCPSTCPAGASLFGDTWSWDGKTWTQRQPRQSPSPRASGAIAYDAGHHVVVLFGGSGPEYCTGLSDTWIWNGQNWLKEYPAVSPPARIGASMAYDAATQQVILFGGYAPSLGYPGTLDDTWAWNGITWTQLRPSSSPPARSGASLAYDEARGQLVLFGGSPSPANFLGDTWTWDGRNWTQQTATGPYGKSGVAMAYDADTKTVILVGGNGCTMSCVGMDHEMWWWDGASWTQLTPAVSPPSGFNAGMVFDAVRHELVLFGGQTADRSTADTWTWSGSAGRP